MSSSAIGDMVIKAVTIRLTYLKYCYSGVNFNNILTKVKFPEGFFHEQLCNHSVNLINNTFS